MSLFYFRHHMPSLNLLYCRQNQDAQPTCYLYQVNSSVKTALFLGPVKRLLRSFSQHLLEWESGTHQSYLTEQNTKGCSEQSTSLLLYLKARQANKKRCSDRFELWTYMRSNGWEKISKINIKTWGTVDLLNFCSRATTVL